VPAGLELIDLRRRFGDVIALDGVSFTVEEGSVVGFVGPNGAGKTTAMRIVWGRRARGRSRRRS
jgi:ABC-2 type transport system ATP-binding protein